MAVVKKTFLVDQVLPVKGTKASGKDYRDALERLGYNHYQQIGSIGGAKAGGSLVVNNGVLTRQ